MEGGAMPAAEVLPLLRIEEHPDVQDVRARLSVDSWEQRNRKPA
jgi:hypothetical protein